MTLPYPKPLTRDQARRNAIHFAEAAHACVENGQPTAANLALSQSAVWSGIAHTFPEDERIQYSDFTADDQLVARRGIVTKSGQDGGTITVAAPGWDVLRDLAQRYMDMMGRQVVIVDLNNELVVRDIIVEDHHRPNVYQVSLADKP